MQHEALVDAGGKQLRMLAKDLRQMLAEALRIGHARCVVLFTIERHTDTLSSGWFHGSDSPYSAVCSIHSIGLEVESSYCLHRFSTNHEIRWNQQEWRRPLVVGDAVRDWCISTPNEVLFPYSSEIVLQERGKFEQYLWRYRALLESR